MTIKTRVLLRCQNEIKKFLFITASDDGSLYFGSSIPNPKEVKITDFPIPQDEQKGEIEFKFKEAKNINPPCTSKFGYHPPLLPLHSNSIIHLKTDKGKELLKYNVSRLETMEDYRKLFVILPKNPISFPNFVKKKSLHDIIIPIFSFNNKPFCVDVYLSRKNYDYKKLLSPEEIAVMGICESKDYFLIIKLYHNYKFKKWPSFNTFIPYRDGIDIKVSSIP